MRFEVLTRLDEFNGLAKSWSALLPDPVPIFHRFEWWKTYAASALIGELYVAVVTEGGTVVAIAPLARSDNLVKPICDHFTDQSLVWIARDVPAAELTRALKRRQAAPRLEAKAIGREVATEALASLDRRVDCLVLELTEDPRRTYSRGLRRQLALSRRALGTTTPLLHTVTRPSLHRLDDFLRQNRRWSRYRNRRSLVDRPGGRSFFRGLLATTLGDSARIAELTRDGHPVSSLLLFESEGKLAYYAGAHDPDFAQFGPGLLNLDETIQWAATERYAAFDFLRGDERYKSRFGALLRYSVFDISIGLSDG